MRNVQKIGLLYESKDDAIIFDKNNLLNNYHYREEAELEKIISALENLGLKCLLLGEPAKFVNNFYKDEFANNVDLIFNLAVGFKYRYRLAMAPALCQMLKIPLTGADPYSKIVSQNKHLMKSFWDKLNIPNPDWVYIDHNQSLKDLNYPDFPLIVKPAYEGSSIGINKSSVVYNQTDLINKILDVLNNLKMPVIVEKFISGQELKVGIIGNEEKSFIGIIEDVTLDGKSLNDQYIYFDRKTFSPLAKVYRNKDEYSALIKDCLKIYDHFLPLDFGTFDIRIDKNGHYYFLEFNADATLHYQKTLAKCCELNGICYESMIKQILNAAFRRYNFKVL